MQRYVSFFTDFGFKRLFGSEPTKDCLIDFLNHLLADDEEPIVDLQYLRTEQIGASELDRKAIFDLYCENGKGDKFIVELQKAKQKFFKDRSVFYSTFPIQEQAQKGDWNFRLKAVYTIGILDFVFDEDADDTSKYLYKVKLTDQETQKVFYDKLTFIYIEMPKFSKKVDELENSFEKWLYAIRNLSNLTNVPDGFHEVVFEQFFAAAEVAQFSPDERDAYERSLKYYRDLNNVIDTAHDEGFEEAMTQATQKIKVVQEELEQERREKEEARTREQEARTREQEARIREQEARIREQEVKAHAARTLAERLGGAEEEARRMLGYED